jgi:hypothetical protein
MKSHREGLTKYFLKIHLRQPRLQEIISTALDGAEAHHPLHLTWTTVHCAQREVAQRLQFIMEDYELPSLIAVPDAHMVVMGETHVKFFAMSFTGNQLDDRSTLVDFVTKKWPGTARRDVLVNDRKETEIYEQASGEFLLSIPMADAETPHNHHVSLFSSNDLKRHNKLGYKKYTSDRSGFIDSITLPDTPILFEVTGLSVC